MSTRTYLIRGKKFKVVLFVNKNKLMNGEENFYGEFSLKFNELSYGWANKFKVLEEVKNLMAKTNVNGENIFLDLINSLHVRIPRKWENLPNSSGNERI